MWSGASDPTLRAKPLQRGEPDQAIPRAHVQQDVVSSQVRVIEDAVTDRPECRQRALERRFVGTEPLVAQPPGPPIHQPPPCTGLPTLWPDSPRFLPGLGDQR